MKKIYNVSLEPISLSSCSIGINKKMSRQSTALLRNTNCWEDYNHVYMELLFFVRFINAIT